MSVPPPGSPFVVSLDLLVFQNDGLTSDSNPILHTRIGPHQLVQGLKLLFREGQHDGYRADVTFVGIEFLQNAWVVSLLEDCDRRAIAFHLGNIQIGHNTLQEN